MEGIPSSPQNANHELIGCTEPNKTSSGFLVKNPYSSESESEATGDRTADTENHEDDNDHYDDDDDDDDDDDPYDDVLCDYDDVLYCDICFQEWEGPCPKHGRLAIVKDTPIPVGTDKSRALKTAPSLVTVGGPHHPYFGNGVWATKLIRARTRFGPYQGQIVPSLKAEGDHIWTIYVNGKAHHVVNAEEPATANWMRYVKRAERDGEQNLNAFQYFGKIYYRTIRDVDPEEQLVVWYSDQFGSQFATRKSLNAKDFNSNVEKLAAEINRGSYKRESVSSGRDAEPKGCDGKPTFSCSLCGESFPLRIALKVHKKKHTDCKTCYPCGKCNKTFSAKGALTRHARLHSGEKPYICWKCNQSFHRSDGLTLHLRKCEVRKEDFQCTKCSMAFSSPKQWMLHCSEHNKAKPFVCEICQKSFSMGAYLKEHTRVHTGEKPFPCKKCKRKFRFRSNFNQHRCTPTDKAPSPYLT